MDQEATTPAEAADVLLWRPDPACVRDLRPGAAMSRPRSVHRKVIEISQPLHEWLTQIKKERQLELGRQVTYTEVIEMLTSAHRPVKS